MSDISSVFRPGHKALISYITVGYPTKDATEKIATVLTDSGCDIIELGIPFSDPLADGATIQKASYLALQNGITPTICLEVARRLHHKISTPLMFMTYYNLIFNFGLDAFCRESAKAGVSGLIVPDLPSEEGTGLEAATRAHGLDLIYLLAPTSGEERIAQVAERSRGFIYLVSLAGVTGARQSLPADLESFVARVRLKARQPLCVGFGVSNAEQAKRIAGIADGVIIGSRILQLIEEDASLATLKEFLTSVRKALDSK